MHSQISSLGKKVLPTAYFLGKNKAFTLQKSGEVWPIVLFGVNALLDTDSENLMRSVSSASTEIIRHCSFLGLIVPIDFSRLEQMANLIGMNRNVMLLADPEGSYLEALGVLKKSPTGGSFESEAFAIVSSSEGTILEFFSGIRAMPLYVLDFLQRTPPNVLVIQGLNASISGRAFQATVVEPKHQMSPSIPYEEYFQKFESKLEVICKSLALVDQVLDKKSSGVDEMVDLIGKKMDEKIPNSAHQVDQNRNIRESVREEFSGVQDESPKSQKTTDIENITCQSLRKLESKIGQIGDKIDEMNQSLRNISGVRHNEPILKNEESSKILNTISQVEDKLVCLHKQDSDKLDRAVCMMGTKLNEFQHQIAAFSNPSSPSGDEELWMQRVSKLEEHLQKKIEVLISDSLIFRLNEMIEKISAENRPPSSPPSDSLAVCDIRHEIQIAVQEMEAHLSVNVPANMTQNQIDLIESLCARLQNENEKRAEIFIKRSCHSFLEDVSEKMKVSKEIKVSPPALIGKRLTSGSEDSMNLNEMRVEKDSSYLSDKNNLNDLNGGDEEDDEDEEIQFQIVKFRNEDLVSESKTPTLAVLMNNPANQADDPDKSEITFELEAENSFMRPRLFMDVSSVSNETDVNSSDEFPPKSPISEAPETPKPAPDPPETPQNILEPVRRSSTCKISFPPDSRGNLTDPKSENSRSYIDTLIKNEGQFQAVAEESNLSIPMRARARSRSVNLEITMTEMDRVNLLEEEKRKQKNEKWKAKHNDLKKEAEDRRQRLPHDNRKKKYWSKKGDASAYEASEFFEQELIL